MVRRVYLFQEGSISQKALLGNKGANLCEMTRLGLPVPSGFVITTETCLDFFNANKKLPPGLKEEYMTALRQVEQETGRKFGSLEKPLLFSVRSGAAVSMPGMMDTCLNLGMNDEIAASMAKSSGNKRWAYDCYRRFIQMFANVVLGDSTDKYEAVLSRVKKEKGYKHDFEITGDDWESIVREFKGLAQGVPMDADTQLEMAIQAVFSSWFTPRAIRYRQYNNIPENMGTAVNVQVMVFGNMGPGSGTGVAFTRNPATGEAVFYGEYLENAEGEDVVSGIRTPESLAFLQKNYPPLYAELDAYQKKLETHHRDMQDIEFTIQEGKLYILQTRNGKRTAKASVQIAVDMVREGLIDEREALLRLDPERMNHFLHPTIDPDTPKTVLAKGLPASPGAATGRVVFCPEDAEKKAKDGAALILVRKETTADDIHGMRAAVGILTEHGGMTSHAAVVARGMGKCCVSGCHQIQVDYDSQQFTTPDGKVIKAGDVITLDGTTGQVLLGDVPRTAPGADKSFQTILSWAHKYRKLGVCANADTPQDAETALKFGANGIGLCRTEHMFFSPERIDIMREMILAQTPEERSAALDKLFVFQKADMLGMFKAMTGKPVTIRLLDPPLHEFLPQAHDDIASLATRLGRSAEEIEREIQALHEDNPMLGFRGCRLSIKHPEITLMQVRAIISAALEAQAGGAAVEPEVMIPLVCTHKELTAIIPAVRQEISQLLHEKGAQLPYKIGTMIEVPRACLTAHEIAPLVEFMSFGTNDLTQMTFGFSRDDVSEFLPLYLEQKLLKADPFVEVDQDGVGQLIKMTLEKTKAVNPRVTFGVCGEQGGEPNSVEFFGRTGLNYVSCSPYRVPIACVAAAQVAIRLEKDQASH